MRVTKDTRSIMVRIPRIVFGGNIDQRITLGAIVFAEDGSAEVDMIPCEILNSTFVPEGFFRFLLNKDETHEEMGGDSQ